jgi:hypothetical protein
VQDHSPPPSIAIAAVASLGVTSAFAFISSAAANSQDGFAAVILPPWWSEQRAMAAAAEAGPILGTGGFPFVIFVPNKPGETNRIKGEWLRLHIPTSISCFSAS